MSQLKDLLPDPPITYSVPPDETVQAAVQLMGEKNVGIVMVMEKDRLVGVFSERDLIRRVLTAGENPASTKISAVMTKDIVFAEGADDPEDCLQKMEKEGCRHMPVLVAGQAIAMISVRDLMRYVLRNKENDLKMLEEYVTTP